MNAFKKTEELLGKYTLGDRQHKALYYALCGVESADEDLVRLAASITNTVERTVRSVKAGQNVNSLGELQSQGPKFDLACQARQLAYEHLIVVADLLGIELDEVL